ncbi:hypothetical protein Ciccas_006044 [Cichlidogyrus casuarinus]|uniref:Hedgehog protein n=1 Tax=Cichlidogyrus casuarinus TaxID=1844966 RepID=A0ABD2Q830_9PLAT
MPGLVLLLMLFFVGQSLKLSELAAILSRDNPHRFSRGEYQPRLDENHLGASGPLLREHLVASTDAFLQSQDYQPLVLYSDTNLMISFARQEYRWMTREVKIRKRRWVNLSAFTRRQPSAAVEAVNQRFLNQSNEQILRQRVQATKYENAFHKAGRGLDFVIVDDQGDDISKRTAGGLARIAYYIVGFDWCTVRPDFVVHCSVKPDNMDGSVDKNVMQEGCFPGSMKVLREDGEQIQLADLRVGDVILTKNQENLVKPTRVIGFLHRDPEQTTDLLRMDFACAACDSVYVTPNHLVVKYRTPHEPEMLFAEKLLIGDMVPKQIANISFIRRPHSHRGSFAPLTEDGTLLVNGIHFSCYAHFKHPRLAHLLLRPLALISYRLSPWIDTLSWQSRFVHLLVDHVLPMLPHSVLYRPV